ncbi:hypothetical protein ATANTOWER_022056 [Ataeniobius toweri]|uniref:Uncharacterized protein n=1 Tax=Ataeniobius toweri TaxID=208326 RepID=A0ABU7CB56_9TELE|nr:hypothetical protein [Ataeniobius toweri]
MCSFFQRVGDDDGVGDTDWAPSPILGPGQQTCRRPSTHSTQKQQRTDGPGSGTPQQPQGSHTPCNNS